MRRVMVILIIMSTIFTVGCWDMKDMNTRIYPYSVGLELNDINDDRNLYTVNFTYPNIKSMGKNPESNDKVFIINEKARNLFEATHKLSVRNSDKMDLKHLKVLAISEGVAENKKLLKEILDGISRDFKINKMVDLLMIEGSVEEFFQAKKDAKRQETTEGSIYSLLSNEQDSTRFIPKSVSEFNEDMDYCKSAHMPIGKISKDENIIAGAAVFKDYKLVGKLNMQENKYLSLLIDHVVDEGLDVEYEGDNLSLEVSRVKTKRELIESGDKIKIKITTKISAQIHEYIMSNGHEINSEKELEKMGKAIDKKIEYNMKKVIDKIQQELNADIIGVYKYLNRYHPKLWKKVKDDWNEIFPKIEIEFDSDVNIRRRGLTT